MAEWEAAGDRAIDTAFELLQEARREQEQQPKGGR